MVLTKSRRLSNGPTNKITRVLVLGSLLVTPEKPTPDTPRIRSTLSTDSFSCTRTTQHNPARHPVLRRGTVLLDSR